MISRRVFHFKSVKETKLKKVSKLASFLNCLNAILTKSITVIWLAAIAQWIHLCLPSCDPSFKFQGHL